MSNQLRDLIINNKYKNENFLLNKINEVGILPYLPDVIIEYILQYLVSITDYITHYIELDYNNGNKHLNYYREMSPYIVQLHNNPNKEEMCKNWEYGEEFLLISKRHENENAFYSWWNNWEESFICDLEIQIKCISKPRNELSKTEKELLKYIMPINKILRINYKCSMAGCVFDWDKDLGHHFQKIIDLPVTEQNELLNIWGYECGSCFTITKSRHTNNRKAWFEKYPNTSWMCSFIMDFMMNKYH